MQSNSLLQHHNSKTSILSHSAFFIVQLLHQYKTTGKIIALTICTFVGKVMSQLFNTLSRFVIDFLQRSKHLLILWLQSTFTLIFEPNKMKPESRSVGVQCTTGEEQINIYKKNEEPEPKQKWCPIVIVFGGESKVQCCTGKLEC